MRFLISATIAALAVTLQLTVVDRMTLPGDAGPSLVLVTIVALALATGSLTGTVTGFAAGLALDVAPPAGHLVGEEALVFCLVGYACGLAAVGPSADGLPEQDRSALFELGVTAAGAVCGEVLLAVIGVMVSDPSVSWGAVRHVLPFVICYDVMLSPFVLVGVATLLRLTGAGRPVRSIPHVPGPARRSVGLVPAAGAVRQLAGGKSPRLRLGEHRPAIPQSRALPSAPKLRFGTNVGASLLGGSVFARSGSGPPPGRARALAGAAPAITFSRTQLTKPAARRPIRIRRGVLARSPSAARRNTAPPGSHAPRFRRPGLLTRLAGALRRPQRARTPGRGWATGSGPNWTGGKGRNGKARYGKAWSGKALSGRSPGKGWVKASRPMRAPARRPARLRMRSRYRPGIGALMRKRRKGRFR